MAFILYDTYTNLPYFKISMNTRKHAARKTLADNGRQYKKETSKYRAWWCGLDSSDSRQRLLAGFYEYSEKKPLQILQNAEIFWASDRLLPSEKELLYMELPLDTPSPATFKFHINRTRVMTRRHREGRPTLPSSVHRRLCDKGYIISTLHL
jgi:hypothetical protein